MSQSPGFHSFHNFDPVIFFVRSTVSKSISYAEVGISSDDEYYESDSEEEEEVVRGSGRHVKAVVVGIEPFRWSDKMVCFCADSLPCICSFDTKCRTPGWSRA